MRIIALIIMVILVSPGYVAAADLAGQTGLAAASAPAESPYTGIIRNKTRYQISIPSQNSDATVIIPPHGWIKYTIWVQHENVTAYHRGQPYYCLNIFAHPREYPFMCKKYDFMMSILPPEPPIPVPVPRHRPRRPLKRKTGQGVEAFG